MIKKSAKVLLWSIVAALLLSGCYTAKTRIAVPAQLVNPELSAEVPPMTYWSDKNILVEYDRTGADVRVRISGDSASVVEAKGGAYSANIDSYGGIVGAAVEGAVSAVIGAQGVEIRKAELAAQGDSVAQE